MKRYWIVHSKERLPLRVILNHISGCDNETYLWEQTRRKLPKGAYITQTNDKRVADQTLALIKSREAQA